jgi:hypothetical protein
VHLLLQSVSRVDYHERKARGQADRIFGAGKWRECRIDGPAGTRGMMLSGDRGGSAGEWAMVVVDGAQKLSGPIKAAREWWRVQIAAGWTVAAAACG